MSAGNTAVRLCMLLSRDRGGEETLTTLLKKMATTPVVKDIHSGANVGYPADLLDLIMQYIFLDGPAGSNSRVAAEELVKELATTKEKLNAEMHLHHSLLQTHQHDSEKMGSLENELMIFRVEVKDLALLKILKI